MSNKQPVAVVSGATGGLGRAIVARLLAEGYYVFGTCTRDPVADPYPGMPLRAGLSLMQCQVERASQVATLRQTVSMRAGKVDLLVVAHGAPPCTTATAKLRAPQMRSVLNTDVMGAYYLCHDFGLSMVRHRAGCIVLLTSIHAFGTFPARAPYSTAKAAVVGLGRALAVEWAPHVRVNMIAPGHVDGPRTRALADDATIACMLARTPARQLVQPDDIAETVLWLTRTPSMTGQVVTVDHGWTASLWYRPYTAEVSHGE